MDVIKISLPRFLYIALREMLADTDVTPSVEKLWTRFVKHQQTAIETVALGIDYHFEHMHKVFPEIVLDLLCHGTIEKGLDASHGGVEYYTFGVNAAGPDQAAV
jgi:formate C-acetyltransferase